MTFITLTDEYLKKKKSNCVNFLFSNNHPTINELDDSNLSKLNAIWFISKTNISRLLIAYVYKKCSYN